MSVVSGRAKCENKPRAEVTIVKLEEPRVQTSDLHHTASKGLHCAESVAHIIAICPSLNTLTTVLYFVFVEGVWDINPIVFKISIWPKVLIEIVSQDIHRPGSVPLTC